MSEEKRLIQEVQRLMRALKAVTQTKTHEEAKELAAEALQTRLMVQGKVIPIR